MVYTLRFFFPLQNAVCFIILTYLVPVLFKFYVQDVLKLKKNNSGAKRLRTYVMKLALFYGSSSVSLNVALLCSGKSYRSCGWTWHSSTLNKAVADSFRALIQHLPTTGPHVCQEPRFFSALICACTLSHPRWPSQAATVNSFWCRLIGLPFMPIIQGPPKKCIHNLTKENYVV